MSLRFELTGEVSLKATLYEQIICYAVAAPRTGNHQFAHAYNSRVPHTWNVINDQVRRNGDRVMRHNPEV